ncbi:MAG: glycoside hydrolase family 2 protein [Lachnospiraceae bacterium]|nr:glycoside hydrolase family 2 protein [Lachnospiraceae bacterium]
MREFIQMNRDWHFTGPDGAKTAVDLPHTWNAIDGQDGGNDYWRGTCLYEKDFTKPQFDADERIYLEFRGVNASAKAELNGTVIGTHDGGYSTFRWDITDLLAGENHLKVWADNSRNDRVYPQKADFTFYGGIYRDVFLIRVNEKHFDMDHFSGPGIKVTARPAEGYTRGEVRVETFTNCEDGEVTVRILDADGKCVAEGNGTDAQMRIENARMWNGVKDPYLYTAQAVLTLDGKEVDCVETRFGVRDFATDPKTGFYLNGKKYPLHGVSRHQDRKGIGNALTKEMHLEDMDMICEMGVNTVRLAHYQHDQYFYDLCDERGMVVWAEIPYISEHMPNGRENTISQMKELIIQNYNHPSIVCWGVSNEITISTKDNADMLDNHRVLNDLCHEMDKTRFTTLACYAMCGPFNKVAHITDVVSWNLYLGWYVPGFKLNDLWIDFFHKVYPNRCLGYSEYGAEAMTTLHSSKPRRGDQTEEYQALYHEYLLECFAKRPFMWATHVWNMFDFAADARDQGGEPGMNHKGLVTFDRKIKKDSFYLYKAWWNEKDPFVHICSKRFADRAEAKIEIKVYSNQKSVTLYCDGKEIGTKTGSHVFKFSAPISAKHEIRAVSGECVDTAVFCKVDKPNPDYKLKGKSSNSANWV